MENTLNLNDLRALILDIDGTLWRGNGPLPGLKRFFDFLQQRHIGFVVVTNNTIKSPAQYRQKFAGCGVTVHLRCVLTASVATASYLSRLFGRRGSVYVIGEAGLRQAIREAGFTLLGDASRPAAAVVVGGDRKLTYDKLKHAVLLIRRGAVFVGANPDLLVPTEEGLVPEAGTTLAAIQAATGNAPTIVGKPERYLFELALAKMDSTPTQTAVLGDRLDTDIVGGQRAGLRTILVTTGIDNEQTISQKGIRPDAIFSGLDELVEVWRDI